MAVSATTRANLPRPLLVPLRRFFWCPLENTVDSVSAAMTTFGLATLLVSWILLMIVSWKEDYAWGLVTLLLPPLSYLYSLGRLDKAGQALLISVVGWVLLIGGLS